MPSRSTNSGLTMTMRPAGSRPTDRSTTKIRRATPTCGAASPMPGAAYIVSIMSSMRRSISGVMVSQAGTRVEGRSPYLRMGRIIGDD